MTKLPDGYEIKEITFSECEKLSMPYKKIIFDDKEQILRFDEANISGCSNQLNPLTISLGVFCQGKFIGWSTGLQTNTHEFYMMNSAILEEHRRLGLYTMLLKSMLKQAQESGFSRVFSRHNACNNSIIIPKLKLGFLITGTEISDVFGILVHLSFYTNNIRSKTALYRTGYTKPDDEIKKHLKLD